MTGHEIYLLICLLMKFYQVSCKRHGNGCSIAVFFKICRYLRFLTQLRNKKLQREISKFWKTCPEKWIYHIKTLNVLLLLGCDILLWALLGRIEELTKVKSKSGGSVEHFSEYFRRFITLLEFLSKIFLTK